MPTGIAVTKKNARGPAPPTAPSHVLNRVLAALPASLQAQWTQHWQLVQLSPHQVMELGLPTSDAVFPLTCVIALLSDVQDGTSAKVSLVGRHGFLGACTLAGGQSPHLRHVVLAGGHAIRLPMFVLQLALDEHAGWRGLVARQLHSLLIQASQAAVCNRHHAPAAQVATLLLSTLDEGSEPQLTMTHETMAVMLGLRRETVSQAAHKMQDNGLLHYRRGHIAVRDRSALERAACECYGVITRERARLLPGAA